MSDAYDNSKQGKLLDDHEHDSLGWLTQEELRKHCKTHHALDQPINDNVDSSRLRMAHETLHAIGRK